MLAVMNAALAGLVQIIAGVVIAAGAVAGIAFSKIKRALKKGKTEEQPVKKTRNEEKKIVTADDLLDDEE